MKEQNTCFNMMIEHMGYAYQQAEILSSEVNTLKSLISLK